jgi:hypothetical protein
VGATVFALLAVFIVAAELFGEYFVLNPGVLAAAAAGFAVMCAGPVALSVTAPATVETDAGLPEKAGTVRDES